jgi:hypothetical protein
LLERGTLSLRSLASVCIRGQQQNSSSLEQRIVSPRDNPKGVSSRMLCNGTHSTKSPPPPWFNIPCCFMLFSSLVEVAQTNKHHEVLTILASKWQCFRNPAVCQFSCKLTTNCQLCSRNIVFTYNAELTHTQAHILLLQEHTPHHTTLQLMCRMGQSYNMLAVR